MQLIKPGTSIDFVGKRRFFGLLSAILVAASVALFFLVGPNWGIDFTGGTEIQLQFSQPIEIGDLRAAVGSLGLSDDAVQQVNAPEDHQFIVRIQQATFGSEQLERQVLDRLSQHYGPDWILHHRMDAQVGARLTIEHAPPEVGVRDIGGVLAGIDGVSVQESPDDNTFYVKMAGLSGQVERAIESTLGGRDFKVLQVDSVGPKVGGDLRRQGFISILATLGLVLVYIAFRFDLTFAPGAVIALFHDVAITIGVFVAIQHEVNLSMIGALLTIVGYSLNDTIVIYDRVRENMGKYRRSDTSRLINDSINETLSRTLNTSLTTLLAILAFLFMGGPVIETFAMAMMIGVVVGTYSTIFVATPMILVMERVRPVLVRLLLPSAAPGAATLDRVASAPHQPKAPTRTGP